MNIEQYELLTGKIIPDNKRAFYMAKIKRVQNTLETLLGYTLEPSHLYTELGKTKQECVCPDTSQTSGLLPADPVKGIIKIFPYHASDKFLHIDPYLDVYKVKLVRVLENRQFITYKTFDNFNKQYMREGIGNFIERCSTCFCECSCECKDCVQLAVDADWIDFTDENSDIPDDLLYLWCDMVDYYADPYKDIKSESVDGHSWSKGDLEAPEKSEAAILLLSRYAGPYGQIIRIPTL